MATTGEELDVRKQVDHLLFASGIKFEWDICHGTNRLPFPPDFKSRLLAAVEDSAAVSEYGPAEGPRPLRAAIAKWESLANHQTFELENVLIAHGATEALQLTFSSLKAMGRETALLLGPQFPTISATARGCGLTLTDLVGCVCSCYFVEAAEMARAIARLRPHIVCLSQPMNPFGTILNIENLRLVFAAARDVGATVVIDKVGGDIPSPFAQGFPPFGSIAAEQDVALFLVDSFSKRRSIPGLRAGYVVASRDAVRRMALMVVGRTVSTLPTAALLYDLEETMPWINGIGGNAPSSFGNPTSYIEAIWENHATVQKNFELLKGKLSNRTAFLSRIDAGINCALSLDIGRERTEISVFEYLLKSYGLATYPVGCFLLKATEVPKKVYQIRVTCSSSVESFQASLERFLEAMESEFLSL